MQKEVTEMGHEEDPAGCTAFEDGGWGHEPGDVGASRNWERLGVDSPQNLQEGTQPAHPLSLAQ